MEKAYEYWLASTEGLGYKGYQKLKEHGLGGKELYKMSQSSLENLIQQGILRRKVAKELHRKSTIVPQECYEVLLQANTQVVLPYESHYPRRLKKIPDPPLTLYYHGTLPDENKRCVAIVGARECTEYGKYVAGELGRSLASCKIQVISGMARGIDGISQRAAAEAGGSVFAVLGSGVDVCYPKQNQFVYERLWENKGCGVLSEYPNQTPAKANLFPPRNRIISGLADVVVVLEAKQKSGTFITVDMALEQGKEVYALPGRVTDRLSDGCNRLLKEGANIFLSPQEFIKEITEEGNPVSKTLLEQWEKPSVVLEEQALQVLSLLDFTPRSVEELYKKAQMELGELLYFLTLLQMKGVVDQVGGQYVRKR